MSLYERAASDTARIAGNTGEFGRIITLTKPTGEAATISGISSDHHLGIDQEGNKVNSRNAHISFHESQLPAGFSIRNSAGNVYVKGYKVKVVGNGGVEKEYTIREQYPNTTTGLIVCILADQE